VPHGHWKTTTFTGALRLTGMTAPFVYDGAMNSNVFLANVEQVLLPTLQPGKIVVMDNLPALKQPGCAVPSNALVPSSGSYRPTARLQSHRKHLLKVEGHVAGSGGEKDRRFVGRSRYIDAPLHAERMRKLLQGCWI
jgi:hypothetical protein